MSYYLIQHTLLFTYLASNVFDLRLACFDVNTIVAVVIVVAVFMAV